MVNSLENLPFLRTVEIGLIGIPLLVHGAWGIKRALEARLNVGVSDGSRPSLGGYGRNQAFAWQRITSWILVAGIVGHVVQMRFLHQPQHDGGCYWVAVTEDAGLRPLAERLGARLVPLETGDVRVQAQAPGTAMLFMVRDTFKSPIMAVVYTVFVLAAAFHACNGLWTALITWGMILSYRSQKAFLPIGWIGAALLSLLGLAAIWGSYWV
jgi:succinate dehydrogenase / fumarate reductase cytochrome b subunit